MTLIEILNTGGTAEVSGKAVLNHTVPHLVKMMKDLEVRNESDQLKASLFIGEEHKESIGEYLCVITLVEYDDPDKDDGIVSAKIGHEDEHKKSDIGIAFVIKGGQASFTARLISQQPKKQE